MTKARDLANVISGSGTLNANVIPNLPTSKITSGTFADARLSSTSVTQHVDLTALSADNLTSGTVPSARLSLGASDIPALATSKITSGTFDDARISSSSVTAHVSAVTTATGTWTPSPSRGGFNNISSAYARTGNMVVCVANGQWSSQTSNSDTNYFDISGLPITPRSGSFKSVGMGNFNAHRSYGYMGILNIRPGTTTMRCVSRDANMDTSNTKTNVEFQSQIFTEDTYGGLRAIGKNFHASSLSGTWWTIELVYQV